MLLSYVTLSQFAWTILNVACSLLKSLFTQLNSYHGLYFKYTESIQGPLQTTISFVLSVFCIVFIVDFKLNVLSYIEKD